MINADCGCNSLPDRIRDTIDNKMNSWLNYIYYRLTKAYMKWDGANGIVGIISIAMIETVILLNLCLFCLSFIYERSELKFLPFNLGYVSLVVFFTIFALNYWRYHHSYEKYDLIWKEENKIQRRVRGVLVVVSIIFPWFLFVLLERYTAI